MNDTQIKEINTRIFEEKKSLKVIITIILVVLYAVVILCTIVFAFIGLWYPNDSRFNETAEFIFKIAAIFSGPLGLLVGMNIKNQYGNLYINNGEADSMGEWAKCENK